MANEMTPCEVSIGRPNGDETVVIHALVRNGPGKAPRRIRLHIDPKDFALALTGRGNVKALLEDY